MRAARLAVLLEKLCGQLVRQKGSHRQFARPDGGGTALGQVRAEFLDALRFHVDDEELGGISLFEHVETFLVENVYIRVAVDRRTLDRDAAVAAVRRSFTVAHQRADFTESALVAATGDAVIVACTPADRLGWLFEQMGTHDALQICVAGPGELVWWSVIAHFDVLGPPSVASQPTVADLMRLEAVSDHRRPRTRPRVCSDRARPTRQTRH